MPAEWGEPVPIDTLFIAAVVAAIASHPDMNATVDGDDVVHHGCVHMGMAVDGPEGLIVPVVHDADRLSLREHQHQG